MRIAKFIARSGLMSRRDAEKEIVAGNVKIDNQVITNLACQISGDEKILLKDKILPKIEPTRLWIYHKREGLITTTKDPMRRDTIFDDLEVLGVQHLITIGRLDKNTEGLLLITNDGDYARKLELPASNIERCYRVKVFGLVDIKMMQEELKKGLMINGEYYKSVKISIENKSENNCWLIVKLVEGKNREIRNIMNYFGLRIKRLIRISYGPYQLKDIAKGSVVEVEKIC